jgi:Response regulator containing CheY-like receiver, AAA-type ATPase, and DNA-binding domains
MSSHHILIVEDQREVSRLLRSALETLEAELDVVEIPSGEEAILHSTNNRVDLLVSDYRLPGMTGIELMRKVHTNHPHAKIILVTGQTDPRIRKEVSEAGADAFFIKPVPMADFLDAVERHLGLVETLLPPEPISTDDTEIQRGVPDLLAGLRQDLSAIAVLLLNDRGRILARAGDLPDKENDEDLISSLLSIYSAGRTVSQLLGQKYSSTWSFFDGGKYDLVFAPVGLTHAMLVIGEGIAGMDHVLYTIDVFTEARKNVERGISETNQENTALDEPPTTPSPAAEHTIKEMEPLFTEEQQKLEPGEVNDYWNEAASVQKAPSDPDMLSYEQAKQLGLTPEDES